MYKKLVSFTRPYGSGFVQNHGQKSYNKTSQLKSLKLSVSQDFTTVVLQRVEAKSLVQKACQFCKTLWQRFCRELRPKVDVMAAVLYRTKAKIHVQKTCQLKSLKLSFSQDPMVAVLQRTEAKSTLQLRFFYNRGLYVCENCKNPITPFYASVS